LRAVGSARACRSCQSFFLFTHTVASMAVPLVLL
jgi:hypothetical protein